MENLYVFGSSPLKAATKIVSGEKYVSSKGDVLEWVGEDQDFIVVLESPLDLTLAENTVENLTEVQLELFWRLCK